MLTQGNKKKSDFFFLLFFFFFFVFVFFCIPDYLFFFFCIPDFLFIFLHPRFIYLFFCIPDFFFCIPDFFFASPICFFCISDFFFASPIFFLHPPDFFFHHPNFFFHPPIFFFIPPIFFFLHHRNLFFFFLRHRNLFFLRLPIFFLCPRFLFCITQKSFWHFCITVPKKVAPFLPQVKFQGPCGKKKVSQFNDEVLTSQECARVLGKSVRSLSCGSLSESALGACLCTLLHVHPSQNEDIRSGANLPVVLGGVGLRSAMRTSISAYSLFGLSGTPWGSTHHRGKRCVRVSDRACWSLTSSNLDWSVGAGSMRLLHEWNSSTGNSL